MIDRVGQRLGNYRLILLLGRGGFADVYLGEHVFLKTQAAIKVLQMRLTHEDLEDFLNEARTIAGLVHSHIIRVLEFGVEGRELDSESGTFDAEGSTPFLVMDYAPNGTLRKRHPKGMHLPFPTILSYVKQLTEALQFAHQQKLIHRDIKPENMLVGRNDEILLSDFGIALVAQSSRNQNTQEALGTLAYMAPEQIQGKPRFASDQYALAVVVYEWLCGDRPFHGSFTELATQHMFAPPPPLQEKVPTISLGVAEVIMTALSKDPQHRFASVQAFANALEQASKPTRFLPPRTTVILPQSSAPSIPEFLSTSGSTSPALEFPQIAGPTPPIFEPLRTPTPAQSLSSPTKALLTPANFPSKAGTLKPSQTPTRPKHRIERRAILVSLAGLAAGTAITWLAWSQKLSALFGSTPTPNPTTLRTMVYIYRGHSGLVRDVAWSPDGRRIASAGSDRTVQVWDATNGGNVLVYRGHLNTTYGYVQSLAWSPDGRRIASAGSDRTVQVWDATNGSQLYTYRGHTSSVSAVAWSPDGRRIASAGSERTVQVWDATNGGNVLVYRGHFSNVYGYVQSLAWSPDSTHIASGSADQTVQVWDAATGNHIYTYGGHSYSVNAVAWSPDGTRITSASNDQTVQVWRAMDGEHIYTYLGHSGEIFTAAWSPNSARIASGGDDQLVQVWDSATGEHVFVYFGHTDSVLSVKWSPDGRRIASGGLDKTVQVWQAV